MRILVIEDDFSIRETLELVLQAFDYEPDLVESAEQALEHLATSWPDVMLLDLTLPNTTGEEVYHNIQRRFGRVPPTIVLSASQQGASRASHLPGARFLGKPYTLEELKEVIEMLAGPQAGAA
jgi:DNA-binding response OmpR family regulator